MRFWCRGSIIDSMRLQVTYSGEENIKLFSLHRILDVQASQ